MKRLLVCALCAAACSGPKIDSFTASRTDAAPGDPVTFSWRVRNADRVTLLPKPGVVSGSSVTVRVDAEGDYTLTASNSRGSASAKIHIAFLWVALFYAAPAEIPLGASTTLRWKVVGADSAILDGQPVQTGSGSMTVSPGADTTYTLVAQKGSSTTTAKALVRVGAPPAISSFGAVPTTIPRGTTTVLAWKATNAQTFTVSDGTSTVYAGPLHSVRVRPRCEPSSVSCPGTTTTYTLTAAGALGTAVRTTQVTVSGPLGASLVYTPPPAGPEALRLEEVTPPPAPGQVVLRLVAAGALQLDAIALNLPFDGATPGSRDGGARVALHLDGSGAPAWTFGGLEVRTGSATPAAAIALPQSGPLQGVLALGLAQKPAQPQFGGPALDAQLVNGSELARFQLDLQPAGGTGIVFDGTTGTGYKLRLRSRAGDLTGAVAAGRLEVR